MPKRVFDKIVSKAFLIRKSFFPKKIIINFHNLKDFRSFDLGREYPEICENILDVKLFEEEMKWLSSFADFVSLDTLLKEKTKLDKWLIAITFDDGYASNLSYGLPICEKFNIPMHWFITTQFVADHSNLPWWDMLLYIAKECDSLLEFDGIQKHYSFNLGCRSEKLKFFYLLSKTFKNLSPLDSTELVKNLRNAVEPYMKLPENEMAQASDIAHAGRSSLLQLGAHSYSHPNLTLCSDKELEKEMKEGRRMLREWSGKKVTWFAYPFGKKKYLDKRCRQAVLDAGFQGALASEIGYVDSDCDNFMIPRLGIDGRWNLTTFQARVLAVDVAYHMRSNK